MYFEDLDLNDNVLDALYDMRFDECTPVQEKCIPEILKGKDVLGVAQTGTGKTAAYLLPVLSKLADGGYPESAINCVIMSPTRELAQQIDQAMQGFAYYLDGVSCVAVYGGNDGNRYDQELKSLSLGADVVIATPGRFISHISLGNVDLSKVSFFILDEADRMLDMGFSEDIMTIAKKLPASCQTIMFSATMPKKIEELAKTLLKNPVEIKLAVSKPAEKIHQMAYVCYETQKIGIIKDIFKAGDLKRVIIFSGSKQKVKQIAASLSRKHINCGEMHSDLDQEQRNDVMFKFKSGQIDVLVATDIVARGIDIDDITMVINYDVPHDAEDYVHRIGRTARADRDGKAITFVSVDDIYYFQQIEAFLEKEIEKIPLPEELGEGPEYKSNGKPKRGGSAKSRRRKDRDQQSHKDKKQGGNKQRSRRPTAQDQNVSDDRNADKQERETSDRQNGNKQKQQENRPEAAEEKSGDKKNGRQSKGRQQDRQPKADKEKRTARKPASSRDAAEKNTAQQAKKPNSRRKKRNNRQRTPEEKAVRRSTKYDIREELPTASKNGSGLKALIKKPLKWLRGFGKR
ncbi:DEAD/DEAH box helicase [Prevotella multiformis]|uniref:DEAD/DEAH box helicase n=1 Tax=Prevotella multiformis TaxID=282402 RepID=UPI001BA71E11|nr:DEAD/DEAH box helicase [Prevotella multiformis]QUB71000.1 DEAD/DEAH box helicase [Prevotella multiformis]